MADHNENLEEGAMHIHFLDDARETLEGGSQKVDKSVLDYECSSFDRKKLYVWSYDAENEKNINVEFYASVNMAVQYLYWLQHATKGSDWLDTDLWKAVQLLIEE